MTWQVRRSNKMLILGVILIIGSFALMTFFLEYVPFFPSDRFTIWLYTLLVVLIFELGFFSILAIKIKQIVAVSLFIFIWSLVFFVPVPQGYEEPIYGGSGILLIAIIILFSEYRKSRKKKVDLGEEREIKFLDLTETEKWFSKSSKAIAAICLISGLMAVTLFSLSHPQLLFTPMPILALAITFMTFIIVLLGAKRYEVMFKALQSVELLYHNKEKIHTTEMIKTELKIDEKKLKKVLNLLQKEKMVEIYGNNIQLTKIGKLTAENSREG
jgi:hypothetical protein